MLLKKRILYISMVLFTGSIMAFIISHFINSTIISDTEKFIHRKISTVPAATCALVPGAKVYSGGRLSSVTYDRVRTAAELYRAGKVKKILVSGDRSKNNESAAMKNCLLKLKIPGRDIFTDHSGVNTYNSVLRAKRIFGVSDMIIVTQKFHLNRSVYIAKNSGINASGFTADRRKYMYGDRYAMREYLARVKAFIEIMLKIDPIPGDRVIPISGDGRESWE